MLAVYRNKESRIALEIEKLKKQHYYWNLKKGFDLRTLSVVQFQYYIVDML